MHKEKMENIKELKREKVLNRKELKGFSLAQLVFKKEELFENVEKDNENRFIWHELFNVLDELHARQTQGFYAQLDELHIGNIA